jgi:hypothetical protein
MSHIHYLNTDLVIDAPRDLSLIVDAFGEDVIVMYHGEWGSVYRAAFEIAGAHAGADETIAYFCCLVENLKQHEQALWNTCFSKVFDIGYESGLSPQNYSSILRAATIQRIAGIGASIEITIIHLLQAKAREMLLTRRKRTRRDDRGEEPIV